MKNDWFPGSVDLFILRTLSVHDLHGYAILRSFQRFSDDRMFVEEGSLYPVLQRLQLNGWIEGAWGVTPEHRPARIYMITAAGRKQLGSLRKTRVDGAPVPDLKAVKSRLLVGCLATGAAFGMRPGPDLPTAGVPVDVCMESSQELLISTSQAKSLTSTIFSRIGIRLTWHDGASGCDPFVRPAFRIRWTERAPSTASAGALAGARPFSSSGASITLYELPIQRFLGRYPNAPELVLAYILAHELAHVMQGFDHHSASGILKANWSSVEYYQMLSGALTFTAPDVDSIHRGLEARRSRMANREGRAADSEHTAYKAGAGLDGFRE